jgi:hypothetical protein
LEWDPRVGIMFSLITIIVLMQGIRFGHFGLVGDGEVEEGEEDSVGAFIILISTGFGKIPITEK